MEWQGFITESKSYIGYRLGNRMRFWLGFPRAAFIFYGRTLRDWLRVTGRRMRRPK